MLTVARLYDEDPDYEWSRLDGDAYHRVEYDITMHHLRVHLAPSGTVLDAGGGPGRYAIAFCRAGYQVTLVDLSLGCVRLAQQHIADEVANTCRNLIEAMVGDIRDLSRFGSASFDAVLCLGGP